MFPLYLCPENEVSCISQEDYFDADTGQWDIEGLQDDLRLAKDDQCCEQIWDTVVKCPATLLLKLSKR